MKIETRWPQYTDGYDRRGKTWSKLISSVKPTAKTGYDWDGRFVREGQLADVEVGSVVVVANIGRRRRRDIIHVGLFQLCQDGTWEKLAETRSFEWAYELRDKALAALAEPNQENPVSIVFSPGQYKRLEEALEATPDAEAILDHCARRE